MYKIPIAASVNYDVIISSNNLGSIGRLTKELPSKKYKNIAIITDSNVDRLYSRIVEDSYQQAGYSVSKYVIAAGEQSKSMENALGIITFLQENGLTRSDALVALGGGVVGDLTGFVASIYLRGIDFIQLPTTLLAAVDSSVGGKTAVNIPEGKNLVGSFWQPRLVLCDTTVLGTLKKEDFNAGVAEAIKYGCIWDKELFNLFKVDSWSEQQLKKMIARCVEIKAEVVSNDEKETGLRAVLNFGHTVAHGIEKLSGLSISHGYAVAVGMCIAAKAGEARGLTQPGCCDKIIELLDLHKIPSSTIYSSSELAKACMSDKKREADSIKFVIIPEIGKFDFINIATDDIEDFIAAGLANFDALVHPAKLSGIVTVPSSKSDAHRAVIGALLSSDSSSIIKNAGSNDDIRVTINVARALGAKATVFNDELHIVGVKSPPKQVDLYCRESGSTLRFFTPIAAALGVETSFYGEGRLPERPMDILLTLLQSHGITVFKKSDEMFSIKGKLQAGEYSIPGDISSQYITGLLFALSLMDSPSKIIITSPLESVKYIDMTIATLKTFGINIEKNKNSQYGEYLIAGGQKYTATNYNVEGDYSSGAFWLCAAAMGQDIKIKGLRENSLQADKDIIEVIKKFGSEIRFSDDIITVTPKKLSGTTIDASGIPDSVPILSVLAASALGTTTIYNAQRLKIKESDRLLSTRMGLNVLGAAVKQTDDGLIINGPTNFTSGEVDSYDDHRIAMSMAIGGLSASGSITIKNAHCVRKSYPKFFEDLEKLGGKVDVV